MCEMSSLRRYWKWIEYQEAQKRKREYETKEIMEKCKERGQLTIAEAGSILKCGHTKAIEVLRRVATEYPDQFEYKRGILRFKG